MKRRLIASLLAVCLVAGLLPTVALAAEGKPGEENAPGCAELEGCVGEAHGEDCSLYVPPAADAPNQSATEQVQGLIDALPEAGVPGVPTETGDGLTGNGTKSDPYIVKTAGLAALSQLLQNGTEDTVYLEAGEDITLSQGQYIEIPANCTIDLDFNGHTLTKSEVADQAPIENKGTLTLRGNGGINGANRCVNNYCSLTVEGGTYTTTEHSGGTAIRSTSADTVTVFNGGEVKAANYAVYNYGKMTVNGGKFSSDACNHRGTWAYAFSSEGELIFNNGEVTGVQGALSVHGGHGTINNGTFKTVKCEDPSCTGSNGSTTFYALYCAGEVGEVECDVYGGNFLTEGNYSAALLGNDNTGGDGGINAKAAVNVYGGTFTAPEGIPGLKVSPETAATSIIHGGSYSKLEETVAQYVDPACKTTVDGGKTVIAARVETDADAVAKAGDKVYASLQAAINEGGEVTLLKSIKESVTVPADKTVILNLNNCTLENLEGQHTITVSLSGSLTIEGHGTVDNISHAKAAVYNNGTIVLSGGTFTRSKENGTTATENGGNSFYNIVNHGIMTIKEGVSVSQSGGYSSMIENGYYNYSNEHQDGTNASEPSLTINGGNFSGGLNTVKNDDNGKLTINGGTFTNSKQAVVLNWNEAEINGGTLDGSQASHAVILNGGGNNTINKGKLSITGGSFDGGTKPVLAAMNNDPSYLNKNNISVTNGTFSDQSVKDFIPEGSQLTTTEDGKFVLAPASGSVAAVGNQGYQTLAEAINAAKDGDTVKLLQSAAGGGVVFGNTPARKLTIDLGENTYTVTNPTVGSPGTETNGFQLLKGNTITFINGTVKAGSAAKILFQNYCDLTLKNVTMDCRQSSQCQYVVSNNHGDTVIEDSKIYAAEGQMAFDVFYWPQNGYGDGVSVTVKGSSEIIGTVEYSSDGTDSGKTGVAEKAKLNIEGGSFKGMISTSNLGTDGKTGIQISGGTFDHEIPSAYCAENFAPVKNSDGTYSVMKPSVSLPQAASVRRGNTTALTATVTPAGSVVTQVWKSENEAIATVDENGKVTGIAAGEATITVIIKAEEKVLGSATCAITVYTGSSSGGGGSSSSTYSITVSSGVKHGSVSVSPKSATKGSTVTITVKPDSGYELDDLTVTDQSGDAVKLTKKSDTQYTFTMSASKVEITVSFVEEPALTTLPFLDVQTGDWFYDAVMFVYGEGMMNGTSSTTFSPDATTTRGMIVTILHRLAGSPASRESADFLDVPAGQYYSEAVAWASENGIVNGYDDGNFGPDDTITREQMAAILYRYAGFQGYDVSAKADLSDFSDAGTVSGYAQEAIRWANAAGLVRGTSTTTISPKAGATRAQVAAILMRFCENVVK